MVDTALKTSRVTKDIIPQEDMPWMIEYEEPAVEPTVDPTIDPTDLQPTVDPTDLQPTVDPVDPTQPTVDPTEPTVDPTQPAVDTVDPTEPDVPFQVEDPEADDVDWSDLDLTGAKDHSLVVGLYNVIRDYVDDDFIKPGSFEELDHRESVVRDTIQTFEGIETEAAIYSRRKAFNELEDIARTRALMVAEEDPELPSISEVWNVVKEDPERFTFNVAQEMINKPELVAAGILGGWGFGVIGARVLSAMNVAGKTAVAAKVTGSTVGAYSGGLLTGGVDRYIESKARGGNLDFSDALEQSHVDGLIGVGGLALGAGVVKGYKATKARMTTNEFNAHLKNSEATSYDEAVDSFEGPEVDPEEALHDSLHPAEIEYYKDPQGNVHEITMKQEAARPAEGDLVELHTQASEQLPASVVSRIKEETKEAFGEVERQTRRVQDLEDLESSDPKTTKELEKAQQKLEEAQNTLNTNQALLSNHAKAIVASEQLFRQTMPEELEVPEFIKIENPDGTTSVLRHIDPTIPPKKQGVAIDGYNHMDMGTVGQASGYNSVTEGLLTSWYRASTSGLKAIAEYSPSARLLLKKLNPDSNSPKGQMWSLTNDITYNQGKFNYKLSSIISNLKNKSLDKNYEVNLMQHMRGAVISEDPLIVGAAQELRGLLNEHMKYLGKRGVKISGKIEDYLPRKYDKKALETDEGRKAFIQALVIHEGKTVPEAEYSLSKILEDFDEDTLTVGTNPGSNKKPVGDRSLKKVPDAALDPILSSNFFADLTEHFMSGVRRAELANVFGDNGEQLKELIDQIKQEAIEAGQPLRKGIDDQNILDLYDAIRGNYKPLANAKLDYANSAAATVINLSKLGTATVTSLTEPLVLLARMNESTGIAAAARTYAEVGRALIRTVFRGMKEHEAVVEAREMGYVMDQAIAEALDQLQGVGMKGNLAKINHAWFRGTFLHQFTETTRAMAYAAAKKDIVKTISKLSENSGDATRTRWLEEVQLDPQEALTWVRNGGDVTAPYYENIKRASMNMASEVIVNPNPINKPLYMSSPKFRLISQLKSYAIVFGNTIMKKQWEEFKKSKAEGRATRKAANVAVTAGILTAGTLATGMLKQELREWGNKESKSKEEEWKKVVRASLANLGPVSILSPVITAAGEQYSGNTIIGTISPAAGSVAKIAQDPAAGIIDLLPGSTLIPKEIKGKMKKTISPTKDRFSR